MEIIWKEVVIMKRITAGFNRIAVNGIVFFARPLALSRSAM